MLRLQGYDVYRLGKTNVADGLSRLNSVKQSDAGQEYDSVQAIVENCIPIAFSTREIEEASYNDAELSQVKGCVRTGNWEHCTFPSYAHIKDELCIYGEILLRGSRIVVPKTLQDKVVRLAHEGHQGIVKTKYRLTVKSGGQGWIKALSSYARSVMAVR